MMRAEDDLLICGLRVRVDDIDRKLFRLLQDRLSVVLSIAARKAALGLPMFDGEREEKIVARAPEEVRDAYRRVISFCREEARAAHRQGDGSGR